MSSKNLGQVAAIVISTMAPDSRYVVWFDLANNNLKYYNFETLVWEPFLTTATIGQIKLDALDSLGYLAAKIDSSLTISGGALKVSNPVTEAEKLKWNGQSTTYFVENISGLAALTPNTGDKAVVADDGDGKRAGYYWTGTQWSKDFDPDWENVNLLWANIVDAATNVNSQIFGSNVISPNQVVETDGSGKLKSVAKNSADNKNFGVAPGTVPQIGSNLDNSLPVSTDTEGKLKTLSAEDFRTLIDTLSVGEINLLISNISFAVGLYDVSSIIGGTFVSYSLRKTGKVVSFNGILTKAAGNADGAFSQICTLPAEVRPSTNVYFPMTYLSNVIDESVIGWVDSNGIFRVSAATATDVVFNATWIRLID